MAFLDFLWKRAPASTATPGTPPTKANEPSSEETAILVALREVEKRVVPRLKDRAKIFRHAEAQNAATAESKMAAIKGFIDDTLAKRRRIRAQFTVHLPQSLTKEMLDRKSTHLVIKRDGDDHYALYLVRRDADADKPLADLTHVSVEPSVASGDGVGINARDRVLIENVVRSTERAPGDRTGLPAELDDRTASPEDPQYRMRLPISNITTRLLAAGGLNQGDAQRRYASLVRHKQALERNKLDAERKEKEKAEAHEAERKELERLRKRERVEIARVQKEREELAKLRVMATARSEKPSKGKDDVNR